MMIHLIVVGKNKRDAYQKDIESYIKQLPVKIKVSEILDEANKDGMKKEAQRILSKVPENAFVISLTIDGKSYSSESFASKLKIFYEQNKDVCFIIGGSYGLHESVIKRSDECLSFSNFTFPHQLIRLMLVEQIYRAFKIIEGHPYHK